MEEVKKKRPLTEKQKAAFERRRMKGYREYLRRKHIEMARKKREEKKRKEKERKKKEKERLKRLEEKKKRRVGRPKKRGPKKKRRPKKVLKPRGKKKYPPFRYKILSCRNGVQNKFIGKFRSSEDAYEVFNALKFNDKNTIFESKITGMYSLQNSIDEYILIEKSDRENTLLRNEYGKLVEQTVNKEGWIVIDKFRYKKEETFWVWGYHKSNDRKTFLWIYNNIILNNITNPYEFKRILIYKNKVIIKDDRDNIDMIICKDESDSIRFYNLLEQWTKRDKIKQIIYIGNYSAISKKRRQLEDELIELTGWSRKKIQMKNTIYIRRAPLTK